MLLWSISNHVSLGRLAPHLFSLCCQSNSSWSLRFWILLRKLLCSIRNYVFLGRRALPSFSFFSLKLSVSLYLVHTSLNTRLCHCITLALPRTHWHNFPLLASALSTQFDAASLCCHLYDDINLPSTKASPYSHFTAWSGLGSTDAFFSFT